MISESQIRSAIRQVTALEKARIELRDEGTRGGGRMALVVRRSGDRVVSEFYAVYYRDARRVLSKVAVYDPERRNGGMTLADARKRFHQEFQPAISAGANPALIAVRRAQRKLGTVRELFEAYVSSLKLAGKRSAGAVERILLTADHDSAASVIGGDRGAATISPADVVPFLAAIHDRGAEVMAAQARAYLSAAFSYGMKSEHDYTRANAGVRWALSSNPIAAIASSREAFRVRDRFLNPPEVRAFWTWLAAYEDKSDLPAVLRLAIATGQRIEEILRVTAFSYEKSRATIYWPTTKNGLPHTIPLPSQAATILDALAPNAHGTYFPNRNHPERPADTASMRHVVHRFFDDHPEIPPFVPKDMRRTWKTLAGDAGLSKEIRDRLQNHTKNADVSARHYDRYDYLAEKRAAMAVWGAYLDRVLAGEITEVGERAALVVPIGAAIAG